MTLTYLNSIEHIWHSSNKWLQSYLSNPNQHVSINGYDPGLAAINWTPLTGLSSRTQSTFIIYERLHQAIKFCKAHHFTNDSIVCGGLQSPTWKKNLLKSQFPPEMILLKTCELVSTILLSSFHFLHQMIALQKLWKIFFISLRKLFSFFRYSIFSPFFPQFSESNGQ